MEPPRFLGAVVSILYCWLKQAMVVDYVRIWGKCFSASRTCSSG